MAHSTETMVAKPMMKCGHAANATSEGKPVCAICVGMKPGADEIDQSPPSLAGRKAICAYSHGANGDRGETDSRTNLPFFEHRPNEATDRYYCGCLGWN